MFDGRSPPAPPPRFNSVGLDESSEPSLTAPATAVVDGRRVELEAADELVLRCGEASIVLTRDGRITIRGHYVETRARGTNRIRGGSVQIN